ncbi:MAG: preprotein translocase subunit YajC [Spirochaetes bacterium]|nr:preprotein translocase subunit YajC [Spirochaetota bacterium]
MNLLNIMLMAAPTGTQGTSGSGNLLSLFLPFIVIMVLFYILLVIPQKRQEKKHQEMVNALEKGDKVITSGGIHGTVVSTKENTVIVKVDDSTSIEFSKSAIVYVEKKQNN